MTQRQNSIDSIADLQDTVTPFGVQLKGIYRRSGAYATFSDRLPVILTRVIDSLSRDKEEIVKKYGKEAAEELKQVIGSISKLKNEIVTNKPMTPLVCPSENHPEDAENIKLWNDYLAERTKTEGKVPTWYGTHALYSECYTYRKLLEAFALTKTLRSYDPFEKQKIEAFETSSISATAVAAYTLDQVKKSDELSPSDKKIELSKFLRLGLWGNRCDLSLSGGAENGQIGNPLNLLEGLEKDILVDDSEFAWDILAKAQIKKGGKSPVTIDLILDNAGYELFTDLCLATFLTSIKLAQNIRIYVKKTPWFISDVTKADFNWMIRRIVESSNPVLSELGKLLNGYLESGVWSIEEDGFWTTPFVFSEMPNRDPALYAKLSEADFAIFKGDLNYRKLVGDINWEYSTNFVHALQGFLPTNFISLRTIKANTCVGLKPLQGELLDKSEPNWTLSGQYGLIQATVDACPCKKTAC